MLIPRIFLGVRDDFRAAIPLEQMAAFREAGKEVPRQGNAKKHHQPEIQMGQFLEQAQPRGNGGDFVEAQADITNGVLQLHEPEAQKEDALTMVDL